MAEHTIGSRDNNNNNINTQDNTTLHLDVLQQGYQEGCSVARTKLLLSI